MSQKEFSRARLHLFSITASGSLGDDLAAHLLCGLETSERICSSSGCFSSDRRTTAIRILFSGKTHGWLWSSLNTRFPSSQVHVVTKIPTPFIRSASRRASTTSSVNCVKGCSMATAHCCTRSISCFSSGREKPSLLAAAMAALKCFCDVSLLSRSLSKCPATSCFLSSKILHARALNRSHCGSIPFFKVFPCSAQTVKALQVSAGRCSLTSSKLKLAKARRMAMMQHEPLSDTLWRSTSKSKRRRVSPTQTVHPCPCSFSCPASFRVEVRT